VVTGSRIALIGDGAALALSPFLRQNCIGLGCDYICIARPGLQLAGIASGTINVVTELSRFGPSVTVCCFGVQEPGRLPAALVISEACELIGSKLVWLLPPAGVTSKTELAVPFAQVIDHSALPIGPLGETGWSARQTACWASYVWLRLTCAAAPNLLPGACSSDAPKFTGILLLKGKK